MPALSLTQVFGDVLSSTIAKWMPQYYDQVVNDVPLLKWLHFKGRKRTELGGFKIYVPVMYQLNSTVKSYNDFDKLDVTPTENFTTAQYDWKQAAGSILISGRQAFQNSGDAQMLNLLKSRIEGTRLALVNELNRQLHLDGTGNTSKDIDGLRLHVPMDPQSGQLLGGFNNAAESWWRNVSVDWTTGENNNDIDLNLSVTVSVNMLPAMFRTWNECSWGMAMPDVLIADLRSETFYKNVNAAQNQFHMADRKLIDAGFKFVNFQGAPVMFDRQLSVVYTNANATNGTGVIYFLNSNFMNFVVGSGRDFYAAPFERPIDQDMVASQVLIYCNLVTLSRRQQGILHTIPNTYI